MCGMTGQLKSSTVLLAPAIQWPLQSISEVIESSSSWVCCLARERDQKEGVAIKILHETNIDLSTNYSGTGAVAEEDGATPRRFPRGAMRQLTEQGEQTSWRGHHWKSAEEEAGGQEITMLTLHAYCFCQALCESTYRPTNQRPGILMSSYGGAAEAEVGSDWHKAAQQSAAAVTETQDIPSQSPQRTDVCPLGLSKLLRVGRSSGREVT